MSAIDSQTDPRTEEVRVALALNGGVSLAIWMGGCAVELDAARRAHLAPESGRAVYHGLCKALGRVLVVDVMSGASAGGINGALLATAIRHRRRLGADWMRGRWIELGDFASLLHRTSNPAPASLMQGDVFARALEVAFKDLMTGEACELPPEQGELAALDAMLDVATTDLLGERRAFRDHWGSNLVAREHRALFRFRRDDDFSPATLAEAARASASFPLAFEPRRISGVAGTLAGFKDQRWVVDGGLLNNAPIATALALIPTRPATRQVRRWVCYINADPPADVVAEGAAAAPRLSGIAGAVLSLPRSAPFVDQLAAIERAVRRGEFGDELPALRLIALEEGALLTTADALFQAYRRRRRLASLEDLLGDPAAAREALSAMGPNDRLPWVPDTLDPRRDGQWQWGLQGAERVLQLFLDVLRPALQTAEQFDRMRLFGARDRIDERLAALDGLRRALVTNANSSRDYELLLGGVDVIPYLSDGAAALFGVRDVLRVPADTLFGPGEDDDALGDEQFDQLLRRAVAIEVITRSFNDDTALASGQRLSFAQLTPFTPSPVFAHKPKSEPGWSEPQHKLTGLALSHFAAFHRRSWRANDFMWGRLDAAARVIDMLVSTTRARQLAGDGADPPPWTTLADVLLPSDAASDQEWLVLEALDDFGAAPGVEDLRARLEEAIRHDLETETGVLTRTLCTRAAQLEILAEELPVVNAESAADVKLGAGSPALDLQLGGALRPVIEGLREGKSPRERLVADDEIASTLAIRTSTHAALVSLGLLRSSGLPLVSALFPLRALLLPIAGSVAHSIVSRLLVCVVFTAAVCVLAARVLGTADEPAALELVWSWSTAVAAIALLVVGGVVLVPAFRGARTKLLPLKLGAWGWALGLLAAGLGPLLLARYGGDLTWSQVIAAPGDDPPPELLMMLTVGFFVGAPLIAIPFARRSVVDLFQRPWAGPLASAIAFGLAAALIVFTAPDVLGGLDDPWWELAVSVCAIAGAALSVLYLIWRWPRAA